MEEELTNIWRHICHLTNLFEGIYAAELKERKLLLCDPLAALQCKNCCPTILVGC